MYKTKLRCDKRIKIEETLEPYHNPPNYKEYNMAPRSKNKLSPIFEYKTTFIDRIEIRE